MSAAKNFIEIKGLIRDDEFRSALRSWLSLNRWIIFLYLVIATASIVFYISNVWAVNNLLQEVRTLEKHYSSLVEEREMLEAMAVSKSSPGRIIPLAETKLNMKMPETPPEIIEDE